MNHTKAHLACPLNIIAVRYMAKGEREPLKVKLARTLDDNLHTQQWHNIIDYVIVSMILLSTLEIFLSTFTLGEPLQTVLRWIDYVTLIFFTVEVSLRIWVAPVINPKFAGFSGRIRYCFTFYGFIDWISTYPFFLQWFVPLPYYALKALRTARVIRLFRISRYMKSFRLLTGAIGEKRHELIISMQFLLIITLILSLMLFFFEHEAQPEVYDNGFVSVLWAFAQYIGDPGEFADTPPVTFWGRAIACVVGLLGIAIVAVPAGIIGAGFTEALENDKHDETVAADARKLRNSFERKLDRPTGYQVIRPFRTVADLMARHGISEANLTEAVNHGPGFRLINLASTIPAEQHTPDIIAVEHFPQNRPYGCMIDRGSNVTVISPSSLIDAGTGNFTFFLALIGGFNYISREIGEREPYRSFYQYNSEEDVEHLKEYNDDLRRLMDRDRAWGVTVLVSSGALEPVYDTQIHVNIGGKKGETRMAGEDLFVKDEQTYTQFFNELSEAMSEKFGILTDHQKCYAMTSPKHFVRKIGFSPDANNVVIRIEWEKLLWNGQRMKIAQTLADTMSRIFAGRQLPDVPALKEKRISYDGYDL